jgi:putative inorganic carbon (hco3(-)) transporter
MHAASRRWALGRWQTGVIAGGAAGLLIVAGGPYTTAFAGLLVILALLAAIGYLAWRTEPAWLITGALIASTFNGNWHEFGVPGGVAPDRVLLLAALLGLAFGSPGASGCPRFRSHWTHALLAVTLTWAVGSALAAGTLSDPESRFFLLDRLAVPFAIFAAAPLAFHEPRHRAGLLAALVGFGLYLGLIALLQTVGLDALLLPGFIADTGFQTDRAQGPFLEASVNGLALYVCVVASAMAFATWTSRRSRMFAAAVLILCALGLLFTLTRSVWIAAVVATVLTLTLTPSLRRFLIPVAVGGVAVVMLLLALFPKLDDSVTERAGNQLTVWERQYVNAAAVEMVSERPLLGFGLSTFNDRNAEFFPLLEDTPQGVTVETTRIAVHNTFLLFAVEQGLVGAGLLVASLLAVVGSALVVRGPPDLLPWRIGLLAIGLYWVLAANFVPLGQVWPNMIPWLWAGVVLGGTAGWTRREAVRRKPESRATEETPSKELPHPAPG